MDEMLYDVGGRQNKTEENLIELHQKGDEVFQPIPGECTVLENKKLSYR